MFQPYYGENKLHINEKTVMYALYMISWIQSAGRYVTPLRHIIMILSQTVFALVL